MIHWDYINIDKNTDIIISKPSKFQFWSLLRISLSFLFQPQKIGNRSSQGNKINQEQIYCWKRVLQYWLINTKLFLLSLNFRQFIAQPRLDNKAAIRYLNPTRYYDNENSRWVYNPTIYWNSTCYSAEY